MQPQADADTGPGEQGSWPYRLATILWPSFLTACALQALVFGWIDPSDLHDTSLGLQDWPPLAIQSLAFLVFWTVSSIGITISTALQRPPPPP